MKKSAWHRLGYPRDILIVPSCMKILNATWKWKIIFHQIQIFWPRLITFSLSIIQLIYYVSSNTNQLGCLIQKCATNCSNFATCGNATKNHSLLDVFWKLSLTCLQLQSKLLCARLKTIFDELWLVA